MIKHSDWTDGYVHVFFNSNATGSGEINKDELGKYVDDELKNLSGNAEEEAKQLAEKVREQFPC